MVVKKAAPKGSGDAPEPDEFTWQPKDGAEPIVFTKAANVIKPNKAIGFFLRLNKMRDVPSQIMFLMDAAGVPDAMQFRVADLNDDEIVELVQAWTGEMRVSLGES